MTRRRACIYCLTEFRAVALTAEPVVPAALGGRLLLELGETALVSPPLETLRKYLTADGPAPCPPRWEISPSLHSPSPKWHVMSFDAMPPSAAAIGLFGTIWFRFRFDFEALAPHGRLVALDAVSGGRGLAVHRQRGAWRHRSAVRWGWIR